MKKFVFAALSLSMVVSTAAFAKDKTVSSDLCYIKQTRELVAGNRFFSEAYNDSSQGRCVVAKIYGAAETSRVYVDHRRKGDKNDGLSNNEVDYVLASEGLTTNDCQIESCIEADYISLWNF